MKIVARIGDPFEVPKLKTALLMLHNESPIVFRVSRSYVQLKCATSCTNKNKDATKQGAGNKDYDRERNEKCRACFVDSWRRG